jgi:hypothetical protein
MGATASSRRPGTPGVVPLTSGTAALPQRGSSQASGAPLQEPQFPAKDVDAAANLATALSLAGELPEGAVGRDKVALAAAASFATEVSATWQSVDGRPLSC